MRWLIWKTVPQERKQRPPQSPNIGTGQPRLALTKWRESNLVELFCQSLSDSFFITTNISSFWWFLINNIHCFGDIFQNWVFYLLQTLSLPHLPFYWHIHNCQPLAKSLLLWFPWHPLKGHYIYLGDTAISFQYYQFSFVYADKWSFPKALIYNSDLLPWHRRTGGFLIQLHLIIVKPTAQHFLSGIFNIIQCGFLKGCTAQPMSQCLKLNYLFNCSKYILYLN